MTTHIILTIIASLIFIAIVKNIYKNNVYYFPWKMICIIIFIILPLSFSGITVISHYLFEISSNNLIWYNILYIIILSIIWYNLYKLRTIYRKENLFDYTIIILNFFILILWYFFAITQSKYESWPTPIITDSIEIIIYWISIQIFIIWFLILLIHFGIKSKNKISITITWLIIFLYSVIFINSL